MSFATAPSYLAPVAENLSTLLCPTGSARISLREIQHVPASHLDLLLGAELVRKHHRHWLAPSTLVVEVNWLGYPSQPYQIPLRNREYPIDTMGALLKAIVACYDTFAADVLRNHHEFRPSPHLGASQWAWRITTDPGPPLDRLFLKAVHNIGTHRSGHPLIFAEVDFVPQEPAHAPRDPPAVPRQRAQRMPSVASLSYAPFPQGTLVLEPPVDPKPTRARRTQLTAAQRAYLERLFHSSRSITDVAQDMHYPTYGKDLAAGIAFAFGVDRGQIVKWFQNRRNKEKEEKARRAALERRTGALEG